MSLFGALALAGGTSAYNIREIGRQRPILRNAKRANRALDAALDKRVDELKPGATLNYGVFWNKPSKEASPLENFNTVRNNQVGYAGSTPPGVDPAININPNADRVYLAHEMGHLASQQTDIGNLVASLRANPKLKNALLGAMVTVPGVSAALEAGDDDMDTSLVMATLATAPTLVDEMLASKNGLAIMDTAGMRASLGQRGKLATGLLSYLAAPLIAGAAGNKVGNLFDENETV